MEHKQTDASSQWSLKKVFKTQTFAVAVAFLLFVSASSLINSNEETLTGQGWSYLRDQGSRIVQSARGLSSVIDNNELGVTELAEKRRQSAKSDVGSGGIVQRKIGGAQKPPGYKDGQAPDDLSARPGLQSDASLPSNAEGINVGWEVTQSKEPESLSMSSAHSNGRVNKDQNVESLFEEGTDALLSSEDQEDQARLEGGSQQRAGSKSDAEGVGQHADLGVMSAVLKSLDGDHSLTLELEEGRIKSVNVVKRNGVAMSTKHEVGQPKDREVVLEEETLPPKSTAHCLRDADGSDICYYGGPVCYDKTREKMVLIDDERKGQEFASTIIFQEGRWTNGR